MAVFTTQQLRLIQAGPLLTVTIGITPELERLLRSTGSSIPAPEQVDAMVDTGATRTVVRCLIGRDILSQGILHYEGKAGKFTLTF